LSERSDIGIRALSDNDASELKRMLHLALFVPPGSPPLPFEAVETPEIARYVRNWAKAGDVGFAAIDSAGQVIGAAWLRLMQGPQRGYGYVDDSTPELSIALEPQYRNRGLGTELLGRLLARAAEDYDAVCLSVSVENPAARLYERLGFVTITEDAGSLTMRKTLAGSDSQQLPNTADRPRQQASE